MKGARSFLLGITGGIGSGKSSVGRLLASYCLAPLIDVDGCCRNLMEVGQPGWLALRKALGDRFFHPDGRLDRMTLRHHLFADDRIRHQVDTLIHPLARETMLTEVGRLGKPLVLVEVPLLYEAGWQKDVDAVLVVYARRGARCCRIMARDGVSRREAAKAIAAQMSLRDKAARADFVIDNSHAWSITRTGVVSLGNALSERFPV